MTITDSARLAHLAMPCRGRIRAITAVLAMAFAAMLAVPAVGATAGLAATLSAAAGRYAIDPSSHVDFTVAQVGGGGIAGRFLAVSGAFTINARDFAKSRVDVTLRSASIATAQPRITSFLKSSAVFDAAVFPVVTFQSFSVERTGANAAAIRGLLTARGKTLPATFIATLAGSKPGRIALHVTGAIYRVPYGMGVCVPIYSNLVQFDMILRGRRT